MVEFQRDSPSPAAAGQRRPLRFARLAVCGAILLSAVAQAGSVTRCVRATGLAVVSAGDVAAAFEGARQAALREAVEEGVGVLISSTTRMQYFQVIDDQILSGTRGYVRSYTVVERAAEQGGSACRVTVDAVVDLGQLDRDLDALHLAVAGAGYPRVLCVGRETSGTSTDPLDWDVLAGELFRTVSELSGSLEVSPVPAEAGQLDARAAAARYGGDIVVRATGQVQAADAVVPFSGRPLSQSGLDAAVAAVHVEARWVDEDRPIAVLDTVGRGVGVGARVAGERALRQGMAALAADLRRALAEDLRRRAYSGRSVRVIVEGEGLSALAELTRDLAVGLGTDGLRPRGLGEGQATFDVHTPLAAFDLARQLSARGLAQRDVEILQVTANTLRFAVRREGVP